MSIAEILGYYAFNSRSLPQGFIDDIEMLPTDVKLETQRLLEEIRRLRENLRQARTDYHNNRGETTREALRLITVEMSNLVENLTSLLTIPMQNLTLYNSSVNEESFEDDRESRIQATTLEEFQTLRNNLVRYILNTPDNSFSELLLDLSRSDLLYVDRRIRELETPTSIPIPVNSDSLYELSYQTLVKQLYGIPVIIPEYLIVNDLKINFITFEQVAQMLNSGQIERYIIEPLLQPWAGPPSTSNKILTVFNKNGMTYLVKVKYDPVTNQIFNPI